MQLKANLSIQADSPPQLESQTHLPLQLVNFSYREISYTRIEVYADKTWKIKSAEHTALTDGPNIISMFLLKLLLISD